MSKEREGSVDIVRGFAVLWMVMFQTLDFFSRDFQLYGFLLRDYLDFVNWVPIFMFVSGVSVWLTVNKRLSSGSPKLGVLVHGLRRYASYVLLSLLLCLWCFSFGTFLRLNEILVAMGVYAIVALLLLLVVYNRELLLVPIAFGIYGLSFWLRSPLGFQYYPFYWALPLFFLGAFFAKLTRRKERRGRVLLLLFLLAAVAVLAALGDDFRWTSYSLGFAVLNVALIIMILPAVGKLQNTMAMRVFGFAGRNALFFYLFHYAVLFKIAVVLNVFQRFDWSVSILVTCLGVALIYVFAILKSRLTEKVSMMTLLEVEK